MPTVDVFQQLLILMIVIWTAAVFLRRFGLPTALGELVMGLLLGPAVLGWVHPSEIIEVLAQLGIFFLMLHTGVETEPRQFFAALRRSIGVAVIGAVVPFSVSFCVAVAFGLPTMAAMFIGLTMTATAVVVTLKVLGDLRLQDTRVARVIVSSCIIDILITLIMFSMALALLREGAVDPLALLLIAGRVLVFFAVTLSFGTWIYPLFKHPFQSRRGKGFTFVLILGLAFGLFAEFLGLHMLVGAYLAGLFFGRGVAHEELVQKVTDRLNGIAYSFLGPIFFVSLGFHIRFDGLGTSGWWFVASLGVAVLAGQILSAGLMARRLAFTWPESLTVGVGMCGRAEMAFVLASVGLSSGGIDETVFSALIAVIFVLNIATFAGLAGCARLLGRTDRCGDAAAASAKAPPQDRV